MANISDAQLLARYRAGDRRALGLLFGRYKGQVLQYLVGVLHDHHQAEDVLQETFVRALERLDEVDPDHLRGWLFTVAYHQAVLARRRQKKQPPRLPHQSGVPDPRPGPLYRVVQQDDARRLQELLGQLPAGQQEVIRQRVYEGKRFREIAVALDCPLNTALARMHEGLKRLRRLWEREHV